MAEFSTILYGFGSRGVAVYHPERDKRDGLPEGPLPLYRTKEEVQGAIDRVNAKRGIGNLSVLEYEVQADGVDDGVPVSDDMEDYIAAVEAREHPGHAAGPGESGPRYVVMRGADVGRSIGYVVMDTTPERWVIVYPKREVIMVGLEQANKIAGELNWVAKQQEPDDGVH